MNDADYYWAVDRLFSFFSLIIIIVILQQRFSVGFRASELNTAVICCSSNRKNASMSVELTGQDRR